METTLAHIMAAKGLTLIQDLQGPKGNGHSHGKIIVRADVMSRNNDNLLWRIKAALTPLTKFGCCSGINNPYYVISRGRPDNQKEFVRVFQSEVVIDNPNPVFSRRKQKLSQICNANVETPVKISVYSKIPQGTDQLYGEVTTTISVLVAKMNIQGMGTTKLELKGSNG